MGAEIDIWRPAAGLGLFLFGMHQLEQSRKLLTGRAFKKFLLDADRAADFQSVPKGL